MKKFLSHLNHILKTHQNIIITGDFNAKHQMWFNDRCNNLGEILSPFLLTSELVLVNNYNRTYRQAVIDLTLVKGCHNLITDWKSSPDVYINSDHNLISFKINLETVPLRIKKWNVKKADWNIYSEKVEELNTLSLQQITEDTDPDEINNMIRNNLQKVAEDQFGSITYNGKHKSWWDHELTSSYREMTTKRRKFQRRSDESKLQQFLVAKNDFYELFKKKNTEFIVEMVETMEGSQTGMWQMMKKVAKDKVRKSIQPIIDEESGAVYHTDEEIAMKIRERYGSKTLNV